MQSTPESIPSIVMAELNKSPCGLRPLQIARQIMKQPSLVGSVVHNLYMRGEISRKKGPGDPAFSYFMTPDQKSDWMAKAFNAVDVHRPVIKVEVIDIPARLRFLEMLAENPAIQDYAQLHGIIGDYRRTLNLQRNAELMEEEAA